MVTKISISRTLHIEYDSDSLFCLRIVETLERDGVTSTHDVLVHIDEIASLGDALLRAREDLDNQLLELGA